MSIEMEHPHTPFELIDAARNWNAQVRIASMIGDWGEKKDDKTDPVVDYISRNLNALKQEYKNGIW